MVPGVLSLLRPNEDRRQRTSYTGLSSLLATSATPTQRTDPIGLGLRRLIDVLTQSGRELQGCADPTLAGHLKGLLEGLAAISCRIAVVGQVKAGKSSFINAVVQRGELLPTHVNPWTAVATRLHFGTPGTPLVGSDFTFFTAEEWSALGRASGGGAGADLQEGFAEMKSRAELRLGAQFHHLLGKAHFYQSVHPDTLQHYLCAGPAVGEVSRDVKPGRYADITKTANIYFPLPPMAVPAVVIDTPGINDPTHLRHRITREIIEGADIYIVVITARQALASADLGLLELLRKLEKQRIIIFINRVDEFNERAGDADVVVEHVKAQLETVFPRGSIPVIAGSAKWAGLAAVDDVEQLRKEAQSSSFQAFAARAGLAVPAPDEHGGDLAALQHCFRSASGLNSVAGLLSLFMLSGFVSAHATGVSNVLLSIAQISAAKARKQLKAVVKELRDLQANPAINRNAFDRLGALIVEINTLLETAGSNFQVPNEELGRAIRQGIARLQDAVEADIRSFTPPHVLGPEVGESSGGSSDIWTFEMPAVSVLEEKTADTGGERSSWLSSVKQATFGFLRKTRSEAVPQQAMKQEPLSARPVALTVPVTAGKDIAMTSTGTDWPDMGDKGADRGADPTGQATGPDSASQRRGSVATLEELADEAARINVKAIAPLPRLVSRFRALQTENSRSTPQEVEILAKAAAIYEGVISDACIALVAHAKVTRQVAGLFLPRTVED